MQARLNLSDFLLDSEKQYQSDFLNSKLKTAIHLDVHTHYTNAEDSH